MSITLLALALALAMDAFAAALCQGAVARPGMRGALRVGLTFGSAQAVMPLFGWVLGVAFADAIRDIDHWVALALLSFLGVRMIREGRSADPDCAPALSGRALFATAVATSIDAAVAGVTLPLLEQPLWAACAVIGVVTAAMSFGGVQIGAIAGARLGRRAEVAGGAMLVALGLKIAVEHQFLGG